MNSIPDVGDVVEYDGTQWRVTGWMRFVTAPADEITELLGIVPQPKLLWCHRKDATHVAVYAVCGATPAIKDVKVVGRVKWPKAHLASEKRQAIWNADHPYGY